MIKLQGKSGHDDGDFSQATL